MPSVAAAAASSVGFAPPARLAIHVRFAGLAVLCAVTLVAPALLLVWMPIVLGVPHIASDVRFLVLPLPRRQAVLSLAACGVLVALKAVSLVSHVPLLRAEMVVVASWLVAMIAARSTLGGLAVGAAAFAIIALPVQAAIVAAFVHNVVAVIAWVVVKRPARREALATVAAIATAVGVLLVLGPAVATATGGIASPWLTVDKAASIMFGGLPLPVARAAMIAFAFLQGVHYAIWLDWIPRGTPRLATTPWLLVTAGMLVVITAALVDATWARTTYLALATFHIYLELVVLAAYAVRRRA